MHIPLTSMERLMSFPKERDLIRMKRVSVLPVPPGVTVFEAQNSP